jgi:nascent polypeptide-associated complex subunit alpha
MLSFLPTKGKFFHQEKFGLWFAKTYKLKLTAKIMFGNIDPKKIASMMSKMGIKQENIEAKRVIIEQEDKKIFIENPSIVKINMQGQDSFQISGEISEEAGIQEDDIKQVMEKTGKSRLEAEKALKSSNGDLAEAILALS